MKIQGIAIIFIIIIVPIYFTLSVYIQGQIEVITKTTSYDSKLQSATYDALKAFQINTVNNNFSSVSDSKIRDIQAATTTFFNSLGTNMGSTGISRQNLDVYVPLLAYTLYDGYYIYTRYDNAADNEEKYEMGLKPYIYYSARYRNGLNNFVINYTLDNYITIIGKVNGNYVMKSGYLINPDNVVDLGATVKYKGAEIGEETLRENLIILDDNNEPESSNSVEYPYLYYNQQKIYKDIGSNDYFYYVSYKKQYVKDPELIQFCQNRTTGDGLLVDRSAIEYYKEAQEFSRWVEAEIGGTIRASHADCAADLDFQSNAFIFNFSDTNDPELKSSDFNAHRASVIKHSVLTNLSSAIAAYNEHAGYLITEYEFVLPKMDERKWDMIENNVTVIAFMQGLPMGGFKYYNGYAVLSNDKNKEVVKNDSIYIIASHNGEHEYHLPNCKSLNNPTEIYSVQRARSNTSFIRKSINANSNTKYYLYPEKIGGRTPITQCYDCIVNSGKTYPLEEVINGSTNIKDDVRRFYLKGIAREKQVLYKTGDYIRKIVIN